MNIEEQTISKQNIDKILVNKDEINKDAVDIDPKFIVFEELYYKEIKVLPYELGFIYLVSLLYKLFNECGKVSLRCLIEKMTIFNLKGDECSKLIRIVGRLRTILFHNLNLQNNKDKRTIRICEEWFNDTCGKNYPQNEEEWKSCLETLITQSMNFMISIHRCVEQIANDEFRDEIVEDIIKKRSIDLSQGEFEELVHIVANNMGMNIDCEMLTERKYQDWKKILNYSTVQKSREAIIEKSTKLIECTLLVDIELGMPITSSDIIDSFNISPSRDVGKLMKLAFRIYSDDNSLTKEKLLEILHKKYFF
ncbi:hypothetical protein [Clostridium coskatii]|uniref:Uncharacterized protein n=1 Tax=Clostridium coskatii TaxID=1705578 RepID=A0A166U3Y9_9CLOT|nr:hypothetical protein [Clostridium coskatii]OAA94540.1 hypothetical protein WX73_03086 [Clostridium coskatii]OBR93284.1 hypothetical protein CLCOS_27560 [Clostridium coskatii]